MVCNFGAKGFCPHVQSLSPKRLICTTLAEAKFHCHSLLDTVEFTSVSKTCIFLESLEIGLGGGQFVQAGKLRLTLFPNGHV